MINAAHVTFKTVDAQIENVKTGEDRKTMDVCEISYPDGKVVAFPANDVSPESGRKYSEMYSGKYNAFKNGEPDADRVKQLQREITERQAELDGHKKAPDDKRVQENLGYGASDHHEPFDHMTKAELGDWITKNSTETVQGDATKDDLVKAAKKIERKQKVAA